MSHVLNGPEPMHTLDDLRRMVEDMQDLPGDTLITLVIREEDVCQMTNFGGTLESASTVDAATPGLIAIIPWATA